MTQSTPTTTGISTLNTGGVAVPASPTYDVDSNGNAVGVLSVDGSTTQTVGGTAQVLFAGATPVNGFKIALPSATATGVVCWMSDTVTNPGPTVAGSWPVFIQGQYSTEPREKPLGPVWINCPTTGQPISAKKW